MTLPRWNACTKTVKRQLIALRHRHLDTFVFIHINKTGGSSVEKALAIPLEHRTVRETMASLGKQRWDKAFKFTVVRNPWDRVVSLYHYRVATNQTNLGTATIDFRSWVLLVFCKQDPAYYDKPKMFMPQIEWLKDSSGAIAVDSICRFETLEHDFKAVCKRLAKDRVLPHVKVSKRGPYRDYYDKQTAAAVGAWFDEDLRRFGYRF